MVLEGGGLLPPRQRTAILLAILWCVVLVVFSLSKSYALALGFLFAAGFLELSFNAMAQSLSSSMLRPTNVDASLVCSTWRPWDFALLVAFPCALWAA